MRKVRLLTPGPTPVPSEALLSMAEPIIHHRTPEFRKILGEAEEGLKYLFQTKNGVLIFASSGTGAMEGAVVNLLSPGDKALVVQGGKFGERWAEICSAYGIETVLIDVEWGKTVEPAVIDRRLEEVPEIKAVFTTLCETSTGVASDIKTIGKLVSKHKAVLVVDAVSGLGAMDIQTDNWGVDVLVAGSQKGLMIPPGLGFAGVSEKAYALLNEAKCPKYYFDFLKAKKSLDKTDTPFTPAINLIIALNKTLQMIKEEGLKNIFKRHSLLARATREAMKAIGLEIYAQAPADAVTSVKLPEEIDGTELVKKLRDTYGVGIAGGQAHLKGKIFRIAHLGYMDRFDCLTAVAGVELVLKELGYEFIPGAAVQAAQCVFLKEGVS